MPEVKDWITYGLALLGIIVTGVFSYLVWKVTKESVNVAQASYQLSQAITNASQKERQIIKEQFRQRIIDRAEEILDALIDQRDEKKGIKLQKVNKSHGLTEEEIALYFSDADRKAIRDAWNVLDDHIKQYHTDHIGNWKGTFNGDEWPKMLVATNQPIKAFEQLIAYFKTT